MRDISPKECKDIRRSATTTAKSTIRQNKISRNRYFFISLNIISNFNLDKRAICDWIHLIWSHFVFQKPKSHLKNSFICYWLGISLWDHGPASQKVKINLKLRSIVILISFIPIEINGKSVWNKPPILTSTLVLVLWVQVTFLSNELFVSFIRLFNPYMDFS